MSQTETYDYIEHSGIVQSIDPRTNTVKVRIDDEGECGDCPAARLCEASGQTSNTVTVITLHAASFRKGDIVNVRGTEQMHRKAITYATVLPCLIIVLTMVVVYILTFNQLAAALSGLGVMVLLFLMLYLCRNKIAHEFSFSITKQEP